jgi:hypothetical protein
MSGITYRYTNEIVKMIKGVKHLIKESIIDGDKGMSFMLTTKAGDKFHRIYVKKTGDDNYSLTEKKDDKESEKTLSLAEVTKMVKANDDLAFVERYLKESKQKGGAKRSSNKMTGGKRHSKKRSSKKSSKKMTGGKRHSKKRSSKKSSKKMTGGKRRSRKSSKKSSKKGSRKY